MTDSGRPRFLAHEKVGRVLQRSAWGLGDQALISAANFATMLVLARELAPAAFGSFVLAYTAVLFVNGLQTALVTQPHNVLGQSADGYAYRIYTTSTALGQLAFTGASAVLAAVAALGASLAGSGVTPLLVAVGPVVVAWQLQEFVRRVLYTEQRLGGAFAIDVVSYGGQVAALVGLATADALTAPVALYTVAATSSVSLFLGAWMTRRSFAPAADRTALAENWSFGKWLGGAIGASWLTAQLYVYLAALLLGAPAAGALRAAQILLGPLNAFYVFLFTLLPIRFSAARDRDGDPAVDSALKRWYAATSPVALAYCVLAAIFAEPLLALLYNDRYASYANVVVLFAVYYVVQHLVYVVTSALIAKRRTRPLFTGNLYAGLLGVAVGWLLIQTWEVEGAAVGMILGAVVLNVVFWRAYGASPDATAREPRERVAAVPPT